MLFPEALTELAQYERFTSAFPSIPVLANLTEFGKTPLFTTEDLAKVNHYNIYLYYSSSSFFIILLSSLLLFVKCSHYASLFILFFSFCTFFFSSSIHV